MCGWDRRACVGDWYDEQMVAAVKQWNQNWGDQATKIAPSATQIASWTLSSESLNDCLIEWVSSTNLVHPN